MKKLFLFLAMAALLLCSACGSSAAVEGTWYSVTDATMYNFANGEVKVSGVTVGQYEDNGDSVVISFMDDGSNMLLYVTKMDKMDVLADVKKGDGKVYFCKGLENAQTIIKDSLIGEFKAYLEENLSGTWEVWDPDDSDAMDYVHFSEGMYQTTLRDGKVVDYPCGGVEYDVIDGIPCAKFLFYWGKDKKETAHTVLTPCGENYQEHHYLYMDDDRWLMKID